MSIAALAKQYDLNDFAEFPFPTAAGDFIFCLGRFGIKAYQDHMMEFNRRYELTGGRRRAKPTDEEREKAMREGIVQHLFAWGKAPDGSEVTREEFAALLIEKPDDTKEDRKRKEAFSVDVFLCCNDRDSFVKARMEEIAGNSAQPSEQTSGSAS